MGDRDVSRSMSVARAARAMSGELETVNEGGATRVLISEPSVQRLLVEKQTRNTSKVQPGIA